LVGPLDDECGGAKNIDIRNLIHNANVSYIGYTDKPENYLSISDILCLPSYREGFGTVVIEAASMGIPTIATNINGLVDAVESERTGLFVEPYSADSLYKAMVKFLENPDMVDEMGQAAQERCRSCFDSEVINNKVFEEYERLMEK
jgi:glycosyltransferase involved in cell wall biosynthesis